MVIHPSDNVEVREDGHKYALRDIAAGEDVVKYGMPIGHATKAIAKGEHVHVDNLAKLDDFIEAAAVFMIVQQRSTAFGGDEIRFMGVDHINQFILRIDTDLFYFI